MKRETSVASSLAWVLILTLFAPGLAQAHPGFHGEGVTAGLLHPLLGWDHLLGMLAIGFWAARDWQRGRWLLGAFSAALVTGLSLSYWFPYVLLEPAMALTLLIPGFLLVASPPIRRATGIILASLFGLIHGQAHGIELGVEPMSQALGFWICSLLLQMGVILLFRRSTSAQQAVMLRPAGAILVVAALVLLLP